MKIELSREPGEQRICRMTRASSAEENDSVLRGGKKDLEASLERSMDALSSSLAEGRIIEELAGGKSKAGSGGRPRPSLGEPFAKDRISSLRRRYLRQVGGGATVLLEKAEFCRLGRLMESRR